MSAMAHMPRPAPMYKNPAIRVDGMYESKSLENGEFIAYSAAANIASNMPAVFLFVNIGWYFP